MNRKLKKTSTPLNDGGKDITSLPFFKNVSAVKNAYKRKNNQTFETPSLPTIGIGGNNPRINCSKQTLPSRFRGYKKKPKCDTPLKPRKSSLSSGRFTNCTQKLTFSRGSTHPTSLSKDRKFVPKESFAVDIGGNLEPCCGSSTRRNSIKELKKTKITSLPIREEDIDEIFEITEVKHFSDESSSILDASEMTEVCRRSSSNSTTVLSMDYSLNLDTLSDDCSETLSDKSSIPKTDYECSTSLAISNSENDLQNDVNGSQRSNVSEEVALSDDNVFADFQIPGYQGNFAKREIPKSTSEEKTIGNVGGKCSFSNSSDNNVNTGLDKVPKIQVQDEFNIVADKSCRPSRRNAKTAKNKSRVPAKKLTQLSSSNKESAATTDRIDVFKKPLPVALCEAKKFFTKNQNLINNVRKIGRNIKQYPSTSTPFDSPEVAKQNLPSLFEDMSPVEKLNGKGLTVKWPVDDILITGIQAKRTYEKRRKNDPSLEKEEIKWNDFLKTDLFLDCKEANNYVSEPSSPKQTSDCYLFESPPLRSPAKVIDDIWKMRYRSLKSKGDLQSSNNNTRKKKENKQCKKLDKDL